MTTSSESGNKKNDGNRLIILGLPSFSEGAVSEARTRDPQLGKLMLYQLSYYRIC